MRHWRRSVSQISDDIEEFLRAEIKLRWPEREYPFHIEVIGSEGTTNLEVRVGIPNGFTSCTMHVPRNSSIRLERVQLSAQYCTRSKLRWWMRKLRMPDKQRRFGRRGSFENICVPSSSFSGCCDKCGQDVHGLHMPMIIHGWYCPECCPVCNKKRNGVGAADEEVR